MTKQNSPDQSIPAASNSPDERLRLRGFVASWLRGFGLWLFVAYRGLLGRGGGPATACRRPGPGRFAAKTRLASPASFRGECFCAVLRRSAPHCAGGRRVCHLRHTDRLPIMAHPSRSFSPFSHILSPLFFRPLLNRQPRAPNSEPPPSSDSQICDPHRPALAHRFFSARRAIRLLSSEAGQ